MAIAFIANRLNKEEREAYARNHVCLFHKKWIELWQILATSIAIANPSRIGLVTCGK